jgi:hypothetical protein
VKNAVMLVLFALVVGGSSAGVSLYLKKSQAKPAEKTETADDGVASHVKPGDVSPDHAPAAQSPSGHDTTAHVGGHDSGPDMGIAARPRAMSVEEILRYGMGLKKREELMKQREQSVAQQEAQMKLVFADIQGEQREIEGLRTQIKEQLAAADKRLVEINQATERMATERQKHEEELKKQTTPGEGVSDLQRDNIKRMSAWFQSMEPTKAAEFLKELSNDGKLDLAVQMLANFEEREAAKVLSAFSEDDKALVSEITEAFKNYKRPEPPKKGK